MQDYFSTAGVKMDFVLFTSYEAQVDALMKVCVARDLYVFVESIWFDFFRGHVDLHVSTWV